MTTIYVGNLPFNATEQDVKALFERHGKVESVKLINDRETGKPRGFGFVDMPQAESESLLGQVFDHAEKREFVYEHVWRVGDLLLWDNRCSSHARTDFPSNERRLMLRTTVKGQTRPC